MLINLLASSTVTEKKDKMSYPDLMLVILVILLSILLIQNTGKNALENKCILR